MIQWIFDQLEERGIGVKTQREQEQLMAGIRMFLWENGIGEEEEKRPYFQKYVADHLKRVRPEDQLRYFLLYPQISQARQIAAEFHISGQLPQSRRCDLYRCMEELYQQGLGSRYVPAVEIQEVLGPWT